MNKPLSLFLLIALLPSFVYAEEKKFQSLGISLSKTTSDMNFDSLEVSPDGFSLGVHIYGRDNLKAVGRLSSVEDDTKNFDYRSIELGLQINKQISDLSLGGGFSLGYGIAEIGNSANDFSFSELSVGASAEYDLRRLTNLPLTAHLSTDYVNYFETPENTRCNDGTYSESVGSGTCSHHGGVAANQEKLGDADGMRLNAGLTLKF